MVSLVPFRVNFRFKEIAGLIKIYSVGRKNKSFNSAEWLKRNNADVYIEKAKKENYRCRSAYKLIEIDDKYKLVKPGDKTLDVGAAPGSWSQVLADRTNSNGRVKGSPVGQVIAIDLSYMYSIDGVIMLSNNDFTSKSSQEKILEVLGGEKLDFVFSDMAPKATGIKTLDQENILRLVYPVLVFSVNHLKLGGGCLIKVWEGRHQKLVDDMKKFFKIMKFVKPKASYTTSSELYLLGKEFLGLAK